METSEKRPKNIFSNTIAKDFRIQTKPLRPMNLKVDLSETDFVEQKTTESKNFSSSSVFKFRKTINLLSTPKLSAMGKINPDNKFERIFLSVEKHPSKIDEDEIDDQIKQKLNDSFEMDIDDQKPKDLVGVEAVKTYYSYYKRLDKIKDKNRISSTNGFFFPL